MYFYPWSSSSFPISSETGRGLTSISLPGLTIATPPNKLWLLLAFFLLEIFCFTLYKDRSETPSNSKILYAPRPRIQCVPSTNNFQATLRPIRENKENVCPVRPLFKIPKIINFGTTQKTSLTNLGINCSKSECDTTVKGP